MHGDTELGAKCSYQPRQICEWSPDNVNCTKLPRDHCYKFPYKVKQLDCKKSNHEEIESGYGDLFKD